MKIYKTKIDNCFYFYLENFKDLRGKTNILDLEFNLKKKIIFRPNQLIITESKKNVFRGLHIQKRYSQEKIISLLSGEINDYILDLRKNSNTFKKMIKINLKERDKKFLYIPKGCAHGFHALGKKNDVIYLIRGKYNIKYQSGVNIFDPKLKFISNNLNKLIISSKDKKLPLLDEF